MVLMQNMSMNTNALDQLKQEGITIILVTHDIGVVADTATDDMLE